MAVRRPRRRDWSCSTRCTPTPASTAPRSPCCCGAGGTACGRPVTFVGLSATLKDAASFFAELTGLDETAVEHIEPQAGAPDEEGREYALALRGDPVSGASLLSASIQAAMLFRPDPGPAGRASTFTASIGFLFTDDLDVTNRFYDDLRDAEGGQPRRPRRRGRSVLAGLRSPDAPYRPTATATASRGTWSSGSAGTWTRLQAGELRVGRTSSQDAGVDQDADLIVATASLEVGFNDPRVGLVLQHKAPLTQPRSSSGAAAPAVAADTGRGPWSPCRTTAATGSPTRPTTPCSRRNLAARNLPVGNRYVLKIQGAQALLDWLAPSSSRRPGTERSAGHPEAPTVTAGGRTDGGGGTGRPSRRLLSEPRPAGRTRQHLRRALEISADEVQAAAVGAATVAAASVVPTALRRLRSAGGRGSPARPGRPARRHAPGVHHPRAVRAAQRARGLVRPAVQARPGTRRCPIERALREAVPGPGKPTLRLPEGRPTGPGCRCPRTRPAASSTSRPSPPGTPGKAPGPAGRDQCR